MDERLNVADVDVEDVILLILALVDQRLREVYGETLQDSLLQQRWQGLVGRVTPDVSLEQRLLLDQASQLNSIDAHVIYTISLSLARRQRENLSARYGRGIADLGGDAYAGENR